MSKKYENKKTIRLAGLDQIKEFVSVAEKCDFEIDVIDKRAVVDAKSFLGMLALGHDNELLVCYGGNNELFEKTVAKFAIA